MKELRFTCPTCGQHVQCDRNHAGENVPCPGCATLIRVPLDGSLTEVPTPKVEANPFAGPADDPEKVSYTSVDDAIEEKEPRPTVEGSAPMTASVSSPAASPSPPAAANNQTPPAATTEHPSELHCVCPVCQSELRISVEPERAPDGAVQMKGQARRAAEHPDVAPGTSHEHLSPAERDEQIAAARMVALRPSLKPRLDRILSPESAEVSPSTGS